MSSKNGSSSADSSGREENEEGNSNIALQTSRAQQLSFQDERSLQQIETESQARNYPFVHYFQQHETQQARLSAGKTDSTTSTDNDDPAYAHRPSFAGEGIFMATSADLIDQSQSSVKGKRGASSVPQSSCVEAGDSVRSSYRAPAQPNTNSGAPEGISSVKFEPNYREGNGNRDILGNLYHPESGFKEAQTSAHLNPAQWVGDSRHLSHASIGYQRHPIQTLPLAYAQSQEVNMFAPRAGISATQQRGDGPLLPPASEEHHHHGHAIASRFSSHEPEDWYSGVENAAGQQGSSAVPLGQLFPQQSWYSAAGPLSSIYPSQQQRYPHVAHINPPYHAGGTSGIHTHVQSHQYPGYFPDGPSMPGPPIQTTPSNKGPEGANLFIFHIPNNFCNQDMYHLFCPYGNLLSVRIMVEKDTGRSRGFGFVSYDSPESAAVAIKELNGCIIGNKRLKVQHKQVRASDPRHALNPYSRESRRKNAEPQDLNAEPAQQASFGGVMNETVEGMFPQDDGEANAGVENLRIEDAHGSATSWTGDDKNDGRTNTAKSRAQGESATLHNFQLDSLNEALAELSSEDKT